MPAIREESKKYIVVSGEHVGKICSICSEESNPKNALVIFDREKNMRVSISKKLLSELAIPGWEYPIQEMPYNLAEYKQKKNPLLYNMLLERDFFCQPKAANINYQLASGETVIGLPRQGFNNSVIIKLNTSGWVELPARIPIALRNQTRFKLPPELKKGDRLVTGCLIEKDSEYPEINWSKIFLDGVDHGIYVPSCTPLALYYKNNKTL